METTEVLKKIQKICDSYSCGKCPLYRAVCDAIPESWTDREIKDLADLIDNYEFKEEDDGDSKNSKKG